MLLIPWSIPFLLAFPSAINARAIGADSPPLPSANTTSLVTSLPVNATLTLPDGECHDIRYCRTLEGLVLSCLVTILACVWFAVHRNIPAPRVHRPRHSNFFVRAGLFVWYKILDQRQAAIVFVVTLLAPEWVLAWALRQWLVAGELVGELEEARAEANEERKELVSEAVLAETEKEASDPSAPAVIDEAPAESSRHSAQSERALIIAPQSRLPNRVASRRCTKRCEECDVHKSDYDQVAMAKRVAKANEAWEKIHAFFIIMGGYQFYGEDGPVRPVSPDEAVELVRRGHLVAPTSDELANQSKGDALSKGVAILQTLWFVMQCIARRIENLPLTNLEVMTLAYTVITVAMYIVWWEKPLNVSCAVRVPEEGVEDLEAASGYDSIWEQIIVYVIGVQDGYVDLRRCTRVPTFWAANRDSDGRDTVIADVIALLVAMVFGAVHCIAWTYAFQSHLEQQLWRASAIAIIAVPAEALASLGIMALSAIFIDLDGVVGTVVRFSLIGCNLVLASIYIAARIALILISFSSLRMLTPAAYKTVQWATFVPHI
ncbi:hypothetical protein HWV62_42142 [Athelia sp. TMB]|nr:hypothetical protein HWV62_42142 [Athelia sp. TMB]